MSKFQKPDKFNKYMIHGYHWEYLEKMFYAQVATCKYVTLVTQEIKVVERQSIIVNLEDMQLRNSRLSPGDKMLRLFPQKFCCGLSNEHLDALEYDFASSTNCLLGEVKNKSIR